MKKIQTSFVLLVVVVFLAAFSRMIPHLQNFSPICSLGLFGAAYFDKRWKAYLIPFLATFLSDIFLSQFVHTNEPFLYKGIEWQYISYALIVGVGFLLFTKVTWQRVGLGVVLSTLIFFLVTNIACWPGNPLYSQDMSGLIQSVVAGIPFIKGTLISNMIYSAMLFGGYEVLQRGFKLQPARA